MISDVWKLETETNQTIFWAKASKSKHKKSCRESICLTYTHTYNMKLCTLVNSKSGVTLLLLAPTLNTIVIYIAAERNSLIPAT